MSISPLRKSYYLSIEDYLVGEEVSPLKHEDRRGHADARSGVTKPHAIIVNNLGRLLGNHLDNSSCIALSSDMKVR